MVTKKDWVTAQQLAIMPDDGYRYELVRGEIRKMAPSFEEHGLVSANVAGDLIPYVRRNGLGRVIIAETGYLLESDPDTVRAPDVSFIRQDRVSPPGERRSFVQGAPDLAIEVLSPGNRPGPWPRRWPTIWQPAAGWWSSWILSCARQPSTARGRNPRSSTRAIPWTAGTWCPAGRCRWGRFLRDRGEELALLCPPTPT